MRAIGTVVPRSVVCVCWLIRSRAALRESADPRVPKEKRNHELDGGQVPPPRGEGTFVRRSSPLKSNVNHSNLGSWTKV